MLEPIFALLRRRSASGKVAVVDVEPGRLRTMGLFEPPMSDDELAAIKSRHVEIRTPYGVSSDPFIARLFYEHQRQREVLAELVSLKRYKHEHGPDDHYRRCQPQAWAKAFALVPDKTST